MVVLNLGLSKVWVFPINTTRKQSPLFETKHDTWQVALKNEQKKPGKHIQMVMAWDGLDYLYQTAALSFQVPIIKRENERTRSIAADGLRQSIAFQAWW